MYILTLYFLTFHNEHFFLGLNERSYVSCFSLQNASGRKLKVYIFVDPFLRSLFGPLNLTNRSWLLHFFISQIYTKVIMFLLNICLNYKNILPILFSIQNDSNLIVEIFFFCLFQIIMADNRQNENKKKSGKDKNKKYHSVWIFWIIIMRFILL